MPASKRPNVYEQVLRADRAEAALKDAERRLARVLLMADAWENEYGDTPIDASVAADAVRVAARGPR